MRCCTVKRLRHDIFGECARARCLDDDVSMADVRRICWMIKVEFDCCTTTTTLIVTSAHHMFALIYTSNSPSPQQTQIVHTCLVRYNVLSAYSAQFTKNPQHALGVHQCWCRSWWCWWLWLRRLVAALARFAAKISMPRLCRRASVWRTFGHRRLGARTN